MIDNTQRFSNRVNNYVKYRPRYPQQIISFLEEAIGFNKNFIVADIGSGTGIFTQLFLENSNTVYAVEPNEPMRNKAEALLKHCTSFKSINGTAEQTMLPKKSIDIITAAQSFHWFDTNKTKAEFKRILKDEGYCMLVWNERMIVSAFEKAYEQLLFEYAVDYSKVDHKNINEDKIAVFFGSHHLIKQTFSNKQVFDFEGLKGRLLSSSYAPDENHPKHNAMIEMLKHIFETFNQNNSVEFNYETKLYAGKLS